MTDTGSAIALGNLGLPVLAAEIAFLAWGVVRLFEIVGGGE